MGTNTPFASPQGSDNPPPWSSTYHIVIDETWRHTSDPTVGSLVPRREHGLAWASQSLNLILFARSHCRLHSGVYSRFFAGATKAPRLQFSNQFLACCLGGFRGYLRRDPRWCKGLRQAHQDILKGRSGESHKYAIDSITFPVSRR